MLRKIRLTLAVLFFTFITLLFLDFTGTLHSWFGWMAKIQFLPAVLALNVGVILLLVALTLVFGRVYCSVICPLGVFQDVVSWISGRRKKGKYRFTYSPAKNVLRYGVLALFVSKLVSKLKLPSILGWLIDGMILGPHALSLVSQELLDAAWYQSVVHVLECAVGLMIGTELVWNKIKKSGRSIIITTLTQSLGMDSRIRRIAQSEQDDAEQAVDHIQKTDKKREQYYRFYSGQQFGDAKNYNLCLNSGVIGIDRCVRILTDIYDAKSSEG